MASVDVSEMKAGHPPAGMGCLQYFFCLFMLGLFSFFSICFLFYFSTSAVFISTHAHAVLELLDGIPGSSTPPLELTPTSSKEHHLNPPPPHTHITSSHPNHTNFWVVATGPPPHSVQFEHCPHADTWNLVINCPLF